MRLESQVIRLSFPDPERAQNKTVAIFGVIRNIYFGMPGLTSEQARNLVRIRWAKATPEDRARQGTWLTAITPEQLSERNRRNALKRWARVREAEQVRAAKAAKRKAA